MIIGVTCCICGHIVQFHCRHDEQRYVYVCELCGNTFFTDTDHNILNEDRNSNYQCIDIVPNVKTAWRTLGFGEQDVQCMCDTLRHDGADVIACGYHTHYTDSNCPVILAYVNNEIKMCSFDLANGRWGKWGRKCAIWDTWGRCEIWDTWEKCERKVIVLNGNLELYESDDEDILLHYDPRLDSVNPDLLQSNREFAEEQLSRVKHGEVQYLNQSLRLTARTIAAFATKMNSMLINIRHDLEYCHVYYIAIENVKTGKVEKFCYDERHIILAWPLNRQLQDSDCWTISGHYQPENEHRIEQVISLIEHDGFRYLSYGPIFKRQRVRLREIHGQ